MTKKDVSVIGAGAWGTALAQTIANEGKKVTLWSHTKDVADTINTAHENKTYLPGYTLSENITATTNLKNALKNNVLLIVTPTQAVRETLEKIQNDIHEKHVLVMCSKGLENESALMTSEIAAEIIPQATIAILSGPNFAIDIVAHKPAGTTLACTDLHIAEQLQDIIGGLYFRPYISSDIIGAQLAGALKNVIAIACGMAHGMNMGDSARASLVTRGLTEIARLGSAMGAHPETFLGLCGVGDMMLTCSSQTSRNFSLGLEMGKGAKIENILKTRKTVTEGVHTAKSAVKLSKKYGIEMPICEMVHKCINEGQSLDEALKDMLNRPVGQDVTHEFE